jgi:hypothetical protein
MLKFEGDLDLHPTDRVELLVADASLARALFEGIPVARLLGRARLAYDERDGAESTSSWDTLMARLLGHSVETKERVKKWVARHTRVAVDEGALRASDSVVATLVFAVASSADADASVSEIFPARGVGSTADPMVARICATFDARLALPNADLRAPMFEACVRLATRAQLGPLPWQRLRESAEKLRGPELGLTLLRAAKGSLFPRPVDDEIARTDRRMSRLDRTDLDLLVAKDPHELASVVVRIDNASGSAAKRPHDSARLDTLIADLAHLLSNEGALVLAIPSFEPSLDDDDDASAGRESRPSWQPYDWVSPDAAAGLADALEKGTTTMPRVRAVVLGGGEPALDAIGGEMLHAALHPFASAAFAEIVAYSARPRDVMRLVTYFAIAPDPAPAARALSVCAAPELPRVLSAWLEAMLPSDGELAPSGDDPDTSSAARLTACVASLAPYPHLYRAVRPLLQRVSDAPPASA